MRAVVSALVLACLLTVVTVPSAAALPACGNSATVSASDAYHVQGVGIRAKVWEESNGIPGLQTASCTYAGATHKADTFIRQIVPHDLGFGGPCVFTPAASQCV